MFKVGDKVYIRAVVKTVINFGESSTFVLTCENDPDQIPLGVFTKSSVVRRDSRQAERDLMQKLKDDLAGTEPMPIKVSNADFGRFAGVSVGTAPLKPYEETQEAKLEAIGALSSIIDVTDDHVTSLMLKKAVKQILQRDFKIDFDESGQEEKPRIPQPRNP